MSDCFFCDEVHSGPNANFARRYPELQSRICWSDGSLFAMPCIGQLQPGHFMVMPVDHHATLRDASVALGSLDKGVASAIECLSSAFGIDHFELLVFEHGARDPRDGGCGIYHAHLHVVPVTRRFDISELFGLDMPYSASSLDSLFEKIDPSNSYALGGMWGEEFRCQPLSKPLPSQYMRRRLAEALGKQEWDWRQSWREPEMLAAISVVQTFGSDSL